jgi:hypothetical protein
VADITLSVVRAAAALASSTRERPNAVVFAAHFESHAAAVLAGFITLSIAVPVVASSVLA